MTTDEPTDGAPLDCNELVELATEYLEGAMDLDTRAEFDLHRLECSGCDNYMQQLLTTIDTLRRTTDADDLDPEFRARLLAAFRSEQSK